MFAADTEEYEGWWVVVFENPPQNPPDLYFYGEEEAGLRSPESAVSWISMEGLGAAMGVVVKPAPSLLPVRAGNTIMRCRYREDI